MKSASWLKNKATAHESLFVKRTEPSKYPPHIKGDKNGLSKSDRHRIEDIKQEKNNPLCDDLGEVWDE